MLAHAAPFDEADVVAEVVADVSSEYCVCRKLSFQVTEPFPAISPPSTPGVDDFARKPLMLSAFMKRKLASTPATSLRSLDAPADCRDRKMAPMSEFLRMSRRPRSTV